MTCVIASATRILSNLTTARHDKSPGEACGEHTWRSLLTAEPIYLCLIFVYLSSIVKFISRYRITLFSAKILINEFHTTSLFNTPWKIRKPQKSENFWFSVFREYRKRLKAWNGLIMTIEETTKNSRWARWLWYRITFS